MLSRARLLSDFFFCLSQFSQPEILSQCSHERVCFRMQRNGIIVSPPGTGKKSQCSYEPVCIRINHRGFRSICGFEVSMLLRARLHSDLDRQAEKAINKMAQKSQCSYEPVCIRIKNHSAGSIIKPRKRLNALTSPSAFGYSMTKRKITMELKKQVSMLLRARLHSDSTK